MDDNKSETKLTPWKNGYYRARSYQSMLYLVDGESFVMHPVSGKPTNTDTVASNGSWKYGDFGDAHPDVAKESGKTRYNVEMCAWGGLWKPHLVLSDDGTKLYLYGMTQCVDVIEWMSDEDMQALIASGDPAKAYSHPYKVQPEYQGKLLWLSGAPGLGKSTNGLLLAKKANYVYFEADAFMNHLNPYVPTDVDEPTLATLKQPFLKGVPQDRIDVVAESMNNIAAMCKGQEYDFDVSAKFYSLLSADIAREHKRIGGDFAIAQAVPSRKLRDHIRKELGTNLIFAVLHMNKEDQMARIKARHGDYVDENASDAIKRTYDIFEPAAEDEPNTIHILITKDMSREQVMEKILRLLNEHSK